MGAEGVAQAVKRIQILFRRGGERRVRSLPVETDRRQQRDDRRRPALEWLSLFHDADQALVMEAINDQEVIIMEPGEILLRPGDPNDAVYLVLSGSLGVHLGDADNPDSIIPIRPGDCLGELSAIDKKPVSALVKVVDKSRILRLSQDVFWNRLMAVPGVAKNLLVVLAQRMRRNTEAMLAAQRQQLEFEHLRQELDVARRLQLGMLPMRRPLFPGREDVEIAGMMEPTSMVGGDLFDAFFVDDQRLFFCIGDVSGHGIAAAMFMARAVSLMRMAAFGVACPAVLLSTINDQLCAGNDANMFLTLFCGYLEVDTGRMVYSNGGHLAPLHWREGRVGSLRLPKGTVLGVMPGIPYVRAEITLGEGELLLCFTDGVTEAQTSAGEEYTESRLMDFVQSIAGHELDAILGHVRNAVTEFSGDSRLADDCTMLAIRLPTRPGIAPQS